MMSKELYLKPEITSETLEPGALFASGSPAGGDGDPVWLSADIPILSCCDN